MQLILSEHRPLYSVFSSMKSSMRADLRTGSENRLSLICTFRSYNLFFDRLDAFQGHGVNRLKGFPQLFRVAALHHDLILGFNHSAGLYPVAVLTALGLPIAEGVVLAGAAYTLLKKSG